MGPQDDWRRPLTRQLLWVTGVVHLVAAASVGLLLPDAAGSRGTFILTVLTAVGLTCLAELLCFDRIAQPVRAWLLVGALLTTALCAYSTVGFIAGPGLTLGAALMLAAVLLGFRASLAVLGVSSLALAVVAHGFTSGLLSPPDPEWVSLTDGRVWLRTSISSLCVLIILATLIARAIERIESALARARQEMAERVEANAARVKALELAMEAQKMETLGQLAAGVAHDFNNSIFVIGMCATLLERRARGDREMLEATETIQQAIKQATALASQLLALARKHVPARTRVVPGQVLASLHSTLLHVLPRSIEVRIACDADAAVCADRIQLQQALLNLAINARDAMPEGGTLSLGCAFVDLAEARAGVGSQIGPGRYVRIEVTDTGSGMDDTTAGRAFETLFTTKPAGQGTGLGLAMVRAQAELSNGHVTLDTRPGQGTTIALWYPPDTRTPSSVPDSAPPGPAAGAPRAAANS